MGEGAGARERKRDVTECWGEEERGGDDALEVMEASVWLTGWVENGGARMRMRLARRWPMGLAAGAALEPDGLAWASVSEFLGLRPQWA